MLYEILRHLAPSTIPALIPVPALNLLEASVARVQSLCRMRCVCYVHLVYLMGLLLDAIPSMYPIIFICSLATFP